MDTRAQNLKAAEKHQGERSGGQSDARGTRENIYHRREIVTASS